MSHCIDNNIFSDSQYSFRNRRGCTLQLLKVLDDWTRAIINGLPVDILYLDLQKGFGSVPHKRLILMGKRELIALLNLSSWCLMMVERLFLAVPQGCLQFVIVVFSDHTHLLFFYIKIKETWYNR